MNRFVSSPLLRPGLCLLALTLVLACGELARQLPEQGADLELLAHSRWQIVAVAMLVTALLLLVLPAHRAMMGGMVAGGFVSATRAPTIRIKT